MAETSSKPSYYVGLDLGGTKILAGVFNSSMECVSTSKVSTKPQRGMEAVIERLDRCVRDAVDEADLSLNQVAAVGIGAPGSGGFRAGPGVISPPTVLLEKHPPLKKHMKKHTRARFLDKDTH